MASFRLIFALAIIVLAVQAKVERRKNLETGLCLDSDGSKTYTFECNGGDFQKWNVMTNGMYAMFINEATNQCLDSNESGKVYTMACNGGDYQKWEIGNRMRNKETGKCLDSNRDRKVYTMACNGGDFQHWYHKLA